VARKNGEGRKGNGRGATSPPTRELVEYKPGSAFPGIIGRTVEESSPAWPAPHRARAGAPNVLFIVLDDVGFAQLGCYGSPIRTPNLDRLAEEGLRYNNLHTTALCSPSRSCILTGRNHHQNAMACITEGSTGFPGSNGNIPFENGFLSEILREHGYGTFAIGKWHLTPADQTSAAGPFDRWPLGRGFDRYYGFLGGDTNQYYPDLIHDNHAVDPPRTQEQGYHLTEDLADRAIAFISDLKQLAPDKPFFLYFAPGAMHAPHHVPKQWADRYRGKFDEGYEKYREHVFRRQVEGGLVPKGTRLSPHDPDVPPWDTLSPDARRVCARMMEVFAGFFEHTDHHIGRLLDFLRAIDVLDETLVMVISDNGASAEGGPTGSRNENMFFNNVQETVAGNIEAIDELGGPKHFNHYPWGWAWAGNTPFRRWKRETYRGGVSNPLIVRWPAGFKSKGEVRGQYLHAIDLTPTVLDCLNIDPPAAIRGVTQSPMAGVSFAQTFDGPTEPSRRTTQYFEMMGHRAIYHDGWRAVCPMPGPSFAEAGVGFGQLPMTRERLRHLDAHGWELYRVAEDFAETKNVAEKHREVLQELIALWYVEAGKYDVLPIDSSGTGRLALPRPQLTRDRTHYVFYPNTSPVPESVAPRVLNRRHSITAEVEIPSAGAEGVLLSHGGINGGYSFFVKDRRLHYVHNYLGLERMHVESTREVPTGIVNLRFEFEPTGAPDVENGRGAPGQGQLFIDGKAAGKREFPVTIPLTFGINEGLRCGADSGSSVTDLYRAPFAFTGRIRRVTVDLSGTPTRDAEAELRAAMARQ
jgi:arylsulfatase